MFVTKKGMMKQVDGKEFLVAKRTIQATKLGEDDELISVQSVSETQNIVLRTEGDMFLKFPVSEVPEKKKGAVGVRGIRLQKQDMLAEVYLFEDGVETKIPFKEREVLLNRLKMAKRDGTGTKMRS